MQRNIQHIFPTSCIICYTVSTSNVTKEMSLKKTPVLVWPIARIVCRGTVSHDIIYHHVWLHHGLEWHSVCNHVCTLILCVFLSCLVGTQLATGCHSSVRDFHNLLEYIVLIYSFDWSDFFPNLIDYCKYSWAGSSHQRDVGCNSIMCLRPRQGMGVAWKHAFCRKNYQYCLNRFNLLKNHILYNIMLICS